MRKLLNPGTDGRWARKKKGSRNYMVAKRRIDVEGIGKAGRGPGGNSKTKTKAARKITTRQSESSTLRL